MLEALRKEPEERYASAASMVEDVKRYLSGFPVHASGGALSYRARTFVVRHRLGVGVAVAIAGARGLGARHDDCFSLLS